MLIFSTQLCELLPPLTFSLVQLPPLYPSLCELCEWGSGPQTDKTCPKVPLQVNFFSLWHFALPSLSLFFLRLKACDIVGIYDTPENTAQICKVMVFVGMCFLIPRISPRLADFARFAPSAKPCGIFQTHMVFNSAIHSGCIFRPRGCWLPRGFKPCSFRMACVFL